MTRDAAAEVAMAAIRREAVQFAAAGEVAERAAFIKTTKALRETARVAAGPVYHSAEAAVGYGRQLGSILGDVMDGHAIRP